MTDTKPNNRPGDEAASLAALLGRFHPDPEDPPEVAKVSLSAALDGGPDPMAILPYLRSLGIEVRTLDDLLRINSAEGEDELWAYRTAEGGVAVSQASEPRWQHFLP